MKPLKPTLFIPHKEGVENDYYDIRILKDGSWLYQGTPIRRQNLVRLFASVLRRDAAGDYWLETPAERGRITVEDKPFLAVEMRVDGEGGEPTLSFRTNLDEWVTADAAHPLCTAEGMHAPSLPVRNGLEARLSRPVYYELMELAIKTPQEGGFCGVWSGGIFHPVARDPALAETGGGAC